VRVLTVNAGSSSLKLKVVEPDDEVSGVELEAREGRVDPGELAELVEDVGPVDAVGHRVVHGGRRFTAPVVVDDEVEAALADLVALAPLHQPAALHGITTVREALPGTANVACFDTAFHATVPAAAATYALPAAWRERWGLRRHGFHGLSHAWAARRSAELAGRAADRGWRLVTCHLGAGASLAAVAGGHSIDTTMGFTPLEGLVMATRSGSVDPGLLLWLLDDDRLTPDELREGLERGSGLVGLAGTADMRRVLARRAEGDADAELALAVYLHGLARHLGAMVASLGGVDAVTFTGGVGERSAPVRALLCERLAWLGTGVDPERNEAATPDAEITAAESTVRAFVVASREELELARSVRRLLAPGEDRSGRRRPGGS
jgi:acetate kinase